MATTDYKILYTASMIRDKYNYSEKHYVFYYVNIENKNVIDSKME